MDEKTLKSIVRMQKRFAKLYGNGLIGISDEYIQVRRQVLVELLKQYPDAPHETRLFRNKITWEIRIKIFDVPILATGTQADWKDSGIEL